MSVELPSVLVVDDEPSLVDALTIVLEREGFSVSVAHDGISALDQFKRFEPDVVLLDVMLPRMSGLDVCKQIRLQSDVPIIMVSARTEEVDAVVGLELGADDYVAKPFKARELVARVRAQLRRSRRPRDADVDDVLSVGDISIEVARHEVSVDGHQIELTRKEYDLLYLLAKNVGRVLSRERIIDEVWGLDYVGDSKTLDVHIRRLRSKIERDVSEPKCITTIRGVGYMLEPTD